jgi:uncharacterized protein (TIGR00255 family)
MINSMTAFARESQETRGGVLTVELRSVNHRYLDCTFKLPDPLRSLEPVLREQAGKAFARGKLECLVRLQSGGTTTDNLQVDEDRLAELLKAATSVAARVDHPASLDPLGLLQFPGIYSAPAQDEDQLRSDATELFARTLKNMRDTRAREGEKLAKMITDRLDLVAVEVEKTRERLPELMQEQRARIIRRIEELNVEVDQGRLEQELTYLAQKSDVDEELDRLEAHVVEVRRALDKGGPCGRRLDFLMQELNREANTLSSKSVSAGTTKSAVELKVLIEQMREQIQNIE